MLLHFLFFLLFFGINKKPFPHGFSGPSNTSLILVELVFACLLDLRQVLAEVIPFHSCLERDCEMSLVQKRNTHFVKYCFYFWYFLEVIINLRQWLCHLISNCFVIHLKPSLGKQIRCFWPSVVCTVWLFSTKKKFWSFLSEKVPLPHRVQYSVQIGGS